MSLITLKTQTHLTDYYDKARTQSIDYDLIFKKVFFCIKIK